MEDKIISVKNGTKVIENKNGRMSFSLKENEGVVLLAKDGEDFILVQQFRKPVDSYIVELPGGGVEQGETLETAVKREFLEETGYECGDIHYLGNLLPAPWRCNEITHIFFTEEIGQRTQQQLNLTKQLKFSGSVLMIVLPMLGTPNLTILSFATHYFKPL